MGLTTAFVVIGHLASTLVLVGIIWTVQIVHYPLMALVGEDRFIAFEDAHAPRMAAVVMMPWTLQGASLVALLMIRPPGVPLWLILSAGVAAIVPVLVTIVWSVPAHARLSSGFDAVVHQRLVRTNWIRTTSWTMHAAIAVAILVRAG